MHSESPKPRPSACTCLRLRKASRQVTQIFDQHLAPYGLTVTQYSLLGHLRALPGITIGALAETMVMDPTSLTRSLKPLERQQFVRAAADPHDRRSRHLDITDAGIAAYQAARPGWEAAQSHVEQALGCDGPPALNAALDELIERLRHAPPLSPSTSEVRP
ncbi:MAG: MarR family transcriptional regulator [Hyphomicrobiales bacterium]|nr:MAG: MarR family transcriptional regulator [Hyphomicrobiales bacterium]